MSTLQTVGLKVGDRVRVTTKLIADQEAYVQVGIDGWILVNYPRKVQVTDERRPQFATWQWLKPGQITAPAVRR